MKAIIFLNHGATEYTERHGEKFFKNILCVLRDSVLNMVVHQQGTFRDFIPSFGRVTHSADLK